MSLTYFSLTLAGNRRGQSKASLCFGMFCAEVTIIHSHFVCYMNDLVSRAMLFLKCDGWSFVDFVALCSCFWFTGSNKTGEIAPLEAGKTASGVMGVSSCHSGGAWVGVVGSVLI